MRKLLKTGKVIFPVVLITLVLISTFYVYKNNLKCRYFRCEPSLAGIIVTKEELEQNLGQMRQFYTWSKQNAPDEKVLEKDALDRLTEEKIILDFAGKNKIEVTDAEVNQRFLDTARAQGGETAYLDKLNLMYGIGKEERLQTIKIEMLKERIQQKTNISWTEWISRQKESINTKNPLL